MQNMLVSVMLPAPAKLLAGLNAAVFLGGAAHALPPTELRQAGRAITEQHKDPNLAFCQAVKKAMEAELKAAQLENIKIWVSVGKQEKNQVWDFEVLFRLPAQNGKTYEYDTIYRYGLNGKPLYSFDKKNEKGNFATSAQNSGIVDYQSDPQLSKIIPKLQAIAASHQFDLENNLPLIQQVASETLLTTPQPLSP